MVDLFRSNHQLGMPEFPTQLLDDYGTLYLEPPERKCIRCELYPPMICPRCVAKRVSSCSRGSQTDTEQVPMKPPICTSFQKVIKKALKKSKNVFTKLNRKGAKVTTEID